MGISGGLQYITLNSFFSNTYFAELKTSVGSYRNSIDNITGKTSLVVWWSESLTTGHEVLGSIPGSTVGIFSEGEDSRGEHCLRRLVDFRFNL